MRCKECNACMLGYFKSKPDAYVCIGVKEPFIIDDINVECTEYPEKRNKEVESNIAKAISHFKYSISHDFFKEPVTSYSRMAVEALEKQIAKQPLIWKNKHYFSPTPNDDWGYECPCCGNREIDYPEHHCICGQALNWDDINI